VLGIDAQTGGDDGIVAADLTTDDRRWVSRLAGCDVVVHCAANGSPSQDWREGQRNVLGAFNVYEAGARRRRPARGLRQFEPTSWAGTRIGRRRTC